MSRSRKGRQRRAKASAQKRTPRQEKIPDSDMIFRRVLDVYVQQDGTIGPAAFYPKNSAISVLWRKYCLKARTALKARLPANMAVGVARLKAGDVRTIDGLGVVHRPSKPTPGGFARSGMPASSKSDYRALCRAHSAITGVHGKPKDVHLELRRKLARMSKWAIAVPPRG